MFEMNEAHRPCADKTVSNYKSDQHLAIKPASTTMGASHTTTDFSNKTVNVPFGELANALGSGLFAAVLAALLFTVPSLVDASWVMLVSYGCGSFLILFIICLPISIAIDVGDRIPEVKKARSKNPEVREVQIRHPQFWAILVLNVAAFWSGIGWFMALAWACSPGKIVIPDEIFAIAFAGKDPRSPKLVDSKIPQSFHILSLEAQLTEINQLVEKGLLTKEEAASRRSLILSR